MLLIERADAWFVYLDDIRGAVPNNYDEVEAWAWSKLQMKLRTIDQRSSRRKVAA